MHVFLVVDSQQQRRFGPNGASEGVKLGTIFLTVLFVL